MHLGDWTQWWRWQPDASWRAPQGPGSRWADVADHPVVHVGWEDATAYARWAGKDLATEAEWEHAARGGLVGRDYGWDAAYADELSPGGVVLADTWQGPFPWRSDDPAGHHRTAPVGSYPANGHGLHDMIGNVWEWTSSRWTDSHHGDGEVVPAAATASPCCGGSIRLVETDRFVTKGGSHLCSPALLPALPSGGSARSRRQRHHVSRRVPVRPSVVTSPRGWHQSLGDRGPVRLGADLRLGA